MEDYLELTKLHLQEEIVSRGLPKPNREVTKPQLIRCLQEDDQRRRAHPLPMALAPIGVNFQAHGAEFPPKYWLTMRHTEASLERICQENWCPQQDESAITYRRAAIDAEYNTKYDATAKQRDGAILRANAKYDTEGKKIREERDLKHEAMNREAAERAAKSKLFMPAFGKLKDLRAAKGLTTYPNQFDTHRLYQGLKIGSASLPYSVSSQVNSLQFLNTPIPKRETSGSDAFTTSSRSSSHGKEDENGQVSASFQVRSTPSKFAATKRSNNQDEQGAVVESLATKSFSAVATPANPLVTYMLSSKNDDRRISAGSQARCDTSKHPPSAIFTPTKAPIANMIGGKHDEHRALAGRQAKTPAQKSSSMATPTKPLVANMINEDDERRVAIGSQPRTSATKNLSTVTPSKPAAANLLNLNFGGRRVSSDTQVRTSASKTSSAAVKPLTQHSSQKHLGMSKNSEERRCASVGAELKTPVAKRKARDPTNSPPSPPSITKKVRKHEVASSIFIPKARVRPDKSPLDRLSSVSIASTSASLITKPLNSTVDPVPPTTPKVLSRSVSASEVKTSSPSRITARVRRNSGVSTPTAAAGGKPNNSTRTATPSTRTQSVGHSDDLRTPIPTLSRSPSALRIMSGPTASVASPSKRYDTLKCDPRIVSADSRPNSRIETESVKYQLENQKHHNHYLFISAMYLPVLDNTIDELRVMVQSRKPPFLNFITVRADNDGYYLVFDASPEGDEDAYDCRIVFNGTSFKGYILNVEINR